MSQTKKGVENCGRICSQNRELGEKFIFPFHFAHFLRRFGFLLTLLPLDIRSMLCPSLPGHTPPSSNLFGREEWDRYKRKKPFKEYSKARDIFFCYFSQWSMILGIKQSSPLTCFRSVQLSFISLSCKFEGYLVDFRNLFPANL